MSDLNELKKKVNEMQAEIERLEHLEKDPRKLKEGKFFNINGSGYTSKVNSVDINYRSRFTYGNIFGTAAEANKHAKRTKVFNLLWDYARIFNDGQSGGIYQIFLKDSNIACEACSAIDANPDFIRQADGLRAIELIGKDFILEAWRE